MRVRVVGISGAGKTHLARRLAAALGVPHVELDALHHLPDWGEATVEEFRAGLAAALDGAEGWVADGNYSTETDGVLHPDTYVWLDYSRRVAFGRVLRRTTGRLLLRRELWHGNRERLRAVLSRDPERSILRWSWTQHPVLRRRYDELSQQPSTAQWVRLRSPREAERWLAGLVSAGAGRA